MGKSAKVHKRVPKKLKSSTQASTSTVAVSSTQTQIQNAQKKANRRKRVDSIKGNKTEGPVLGDADYVTLMMGGRRKAKEEAAKLPRDEA